MSENKIGVVTVTFGSEKVLPDFLRSLFAQQSCDFRLYAVDNASKDRTLALLREQDDSRVRLIANSVNVGVARGNNQGIEAALADGCSHVLLLNNDVEFGPDLFSRMLNSLRSSKADGVVPLMTFWESQDRIWYGGGGFNWPKPFPTRHEYFNRPIHELPAGIRTVDYAPTCCMLLNRDVFERIGLMDEEYFVYCDDSDFCLRMCRAGCRLAFDPSLSLAHKVSALTGKESDFSIRFQTRNTVRFVRKHYGALPAGFRIAVLLGHTFAKAVLGRLSVQALKVKIMAIVEGIKMPLAARRH